MDRLQKLKDIHSIFLKSIENIVLGEILVGTLVYATPWNISPKSDIDSMVIVKRERLEEMLKSKFLKGLLDSRTALEALDKRIADYLVLKGSSDGIDYSVDIIPHDFFELMCNIDLTKQRRSWESAKFGNLPQKNSYPSTEFNRRVHMIEKRNVEFEGGYAVELPLFFIFDNNQQLNYSYGMPTIKLITSKVNIDNGNISRNINNLFTNVVRRMFFEYPGKTDKEYCDYFFNLLVKRDKFPQDYSSALRKKVRTELKCQKN